MNNQVPFPLNVLTWIAESFINAFGITAPRPGQRRIVSLVLGGILLAAGLAAVAMLGFLLWESHLARH